FSRAHCWSGRDHQFTKMMH
ncbi:hypothetical protein AZZ81_004087, partial [Klebsiella aerogenes]